MTKAYSLSLFASLMLQAGCAGSYGCKGFPHLPVCQSAIEAYRATEGPSAGNDHEAAVPSTKSPMKTEEGLNEAIKAGRANPSILRIWLAPYEDEEGDLESTRFVFTDLEPRRWTLGSGHQQQTIRLTPLEVSQRPSGEPRPSPRSLSPPSLKSPSEGYEEDS